MTLKKLLKKNPEYMYKRITLIDLTNHWDLPLHIDYLFPKPLHKYYKKLLKSKVTKVFINENNIEIQVE